MRIEPNEYGILELKEVYNPIVLISNAGEKIYITMRDSGFELGYNGKAFEAKNGVVKSFEYSSRIAQDLITKNRKEMTTLEEIKVLFPLFINNIKEGKTENMNSEQLRTKNEDRILFQSLGSLLKEKIDLILENQTL